MGELGAVLTEARLVLLEAPGADRVHPLLETPDQARPLVTGVVEAARVADVLQQSFERGIDGGRHDKHGRTNPTTAPAIWSSARTRSTAPLAIAADGMPK